MHTSTDRIQSLDVLRGIAVILMVTGHSVDAVLGPDGRSTDLFRVYDAFRGFTAPLFLFLSGFAFTIATEKRWQEYTSPGPAVARRLLRVIMLLTIGYALHAPFFSLGKILHGAAPQDLAQFYQADVLHCVAVALLMLQVLVLTARVPRRYAFYTAGCGVFVTAAAPFLWATDFSSVLPRFLTPYLNQYQLSVFPVFPYAAYMFAGAAIGHWFREAASKGSGARALHAPLRLTAALALGGIGVTVISLPVVSDYDMWKASAAIIGVRLFVVVAATTFVFRVNSWPASLSRPLVRLGRNSLLIYAVHIVLVYGSVLTDGLVQRVGQTLSAPMAFAIGFCVVAVMALMVRSWEYLQSRHILPVRLAQISAATILLYTFIIRPY